jgi:AraC family transcriptional regulator
MDKGTQQMKPSPQSEEYRARIHRVQDFIERNIQETLSLEALAKVACFSPFHFHRIFSAMTGETLGQFIARVRIEKAAMKLTANPKLSITTIALECGFSGSAAFARSFNETFGMSASTWRNGGYHIFSKGRKTESNPGKTIGKQRKATDTPLSYLDGVLIGEGASPVQHPLKTRSGSMKSVSSVKAEVYVENFPEMTVAYVRHVGPYKGNGQLFGVLWGKLLKWAGPRGLMAQPDVKMLCVYHDDPEVTDEQKLRVSVCITVPSVTRVDGEVGLMSIASGAYATARFEINDQEFQAAWDYMFGVWLPQSGYQPDDRLCFEWCMNDPQKHPEHKHIVKICIPVKPL